MLEKIEHGQISLHSTCVTLAPVFVKFCASTELTGVSLGVVRPLQTAWSVFMIRLFTHQSLYEVRHSSRPAAAAGINRVYVTRSAATSLASGTDDHHAARAEARQEKHSAGMIRTLFQKADIELMAFSFEVIESAT